MKTFLIYDDMTPGGVIPNGFGMSLNEYNRHRFKEKGRSNLNFRHVDFIKNAVPIHKKTFQADKAFFQANGEILYIVSLSRGADSYYELFQIGMNNWLMYLDEEILNLVRQKQIKLVLASYTERFPLNLLREMFNRLTETLGPNPHFEFWHAWPYPNMYLDERLGQYRQFLNYVPFWEMRTLQFLEVPEEHYGERSKKFIKLTRRYTEERVFIQAYILKHGLQNDGYLSMPAKDPTTEKDFKTYLDSINQNYGKDVIDETMQILRNGDLHYKLDMDPVSDYQRTPFNSSHWGFPEKGDLRNFYNDSYLSLIPCAELSANTFMFSEATYRAILNRHLFILVGPRHFLHSLRELGYQTFSEFWSEDYDNIEDDFERIRASLDVFKDVVKNKDLADIYNLARPILNHNLLTLKNKVEQFSNKYS